MPAQPGVPQATHKNTPHRPQPAWMDDDLPCKHEPDVFHPEKGQGLLLERAKQLCVECSYTAECLVHALNHDERFGVWGGASAEERREIRRRVRE